MMTPCLMCGRLQFATCHEAGHGPWCFVCTGGATRCPRCAAVPAMTLRAVGWLAAFGMSAAMWAAIGAAALPWMSR